MHNKWGTHNDIGVASPTTPKLESLTYISGCVYRKWIEGERLVVLQARNWDTRVVPPFVTLPFRERGWGRENLIYEVSR
jgi:zona occludens toxin (predicted ATPase)